MQGGMRMGKGNDLRYVKVEEAIRAAFLELLEGRPLESITVSQICQLARCSRNAFYSHHAGRDELCSALLDEFSDILRVACAEENERLRHGVGDSRGIAGSVIGAFRAHEALLRVLLASDNGVFACVLRDVVERAYLDSLEALTGEWPNQRLRLMVSYASAGVVALATRWLGEGIAFEEASEACAVVQVPVSETIKRQVGLGRMTSRLPTPHEIPSTIGGCHDRCV